ncbi:MAG TPA: HAMP domain-containing histidine kinase, partial [Rhodospirillales bacterium]|nr:HAMP domain-containing histidine kinase [Rhodospirillales bacterium]
TTIRITLRQGPKGPIGVISDNGGGIPESDREKIFRRFYRLEASRSTPGSGLGLALVKAIADLHGTAITITDNHPGSVFTIFFDDR